MNELIKIEIKNYIKRIIISKSRRKVYIKEGEKLPLRYAKKPEKYQFINGFLYDIEVNEKIIRNQRTHGKPKYKKISGNDMWAGVNYHLRSKIASEMKKFFYEYFRGITPLKASDYPVGISLDIIDNVEGREGEDIDNLSYLYRKTIHDALCGNVEFVKVVDPEGKSSFVPDYDKYPKIIEDDNRDYIKEITTRLSYEDIPDEETSMTITIYKL